MKRFPWLILPVFLFLFCCESNPSSPAQQVTYQPFAGSASPAFTLDSGTKLTILGYSGGSPSDTAIIYFPFLVTNDQTGDTLRILSALISVDNEEDPLKETLTPASTYNMDKGIREAIFEPVTENQGTILELTALATGKVDTGIDAATGNSKKKPAYVVINHSFPILQDPRFKTVVGVLRFKQIPC